MLLSSLLVAATAALSASAQLTFQSAPNCGLPADPTCLIKNAQYTVVGTVMSTNLGSSPLATPGSYNATVAIRCLWGSFSSPPSPGTGLAGATVLVANFGFPKAGCPANTGSQAVVNDTRIMFLYVAAPAPNGAPTSQAVFAVQDICVGGLPYNSANVQVVASVLEQFPSNKIPLANQGIQSQCALPVLTPPTTGTGAGGNTGSTSSPTAVTVPGSASIVEGRFVAVAAAVLLG
ncbi:hypothetical protein BC831DRAFT_394011, partial [Entophlyctis helioformis]